MQILSCDKEGVIASLSLDVHTLAHSTDLKALISKQAAEDLLTNRPPTVVALGR